MNEMQWHGWVRGYRWQVMLLEGLGVRGAREYDGTYISSCIVDDDGLARLMRYWPCLDEWYPPSSWSWKRRIEDVFTLVNLNGIQIWGEQRDRRLEVIHAIAEELPDVWPDAVVDIVRFH